MNSKQKIMLRRIIIAVVMTIVVCVLNNGDDAALPLWQWGRGLVYYLIIYIIIGNDILRKSWNGVCHGRVFDENFLMTIATIGVFALAICEDSGDYLEAVAVMLFYQVGELFQSYAVGRSRKDIAALMDIRPDYANHEQEDGTTVKVSPDDVEEGSIIVVYPGEKVPIDGIVESGESSLNTIALTGESLPRDVHEGDEVMSGCINMSSPLRIRTTTDFDESAVSRILELVEDSASHKARTENFIARFARIYTPAVCYSALALALLPPVVCIIIGSEALWSEWIYRALTFLVISCPCALVVSIPLSFFAGIGGASREGILVKGADILEVMAKIKTVVMDKTGTLTKGVFEVTKIDSSAMSADALLELAAYAESASSHPVARSIVKAYGKQIDNHRVADIAEHSGHGITATVDGRNIIIGNERMMQAHNVSIGGSASGTVVYVAMEINSTFNYLGSISLGDVVKQQSAVAVRQMHDCGVRQVVMLTGDRQDVADAVAREVGIDRVFSNQLPSDKVQRIEELMHSSLSAGEGGGRGIAFVGDGINDAPVLMRADVGIAMGGAGSDAAIEASDVVLMDDDPQKIATAIRISRKTVGIVWQNIVMALGIKGACLLLGALGIANMWLAIFADVGVMVIAVLNAMRCMSFKD